jgi:hypothetical protein
MRQITIKDAETGEVTVRDMTESEISALEPTIGQLRADASLPRSKFLQACAAAGVVEPSVAEEAASGVWPSAFNEFLTGLSFEQRIEAKATWVDGQRVRRDSPVLALIATEQGVTDEQLDAMFGLGG